MNTEFLVPTGFIIKDYLDELDINQKELSLRMGLSEKHLSNVLNGKSKLTEEFAIKLEKIIHAAPASYWLNYETKYREYKTRNDLMNDIDKNELKELDQRFKFSSLFSELGLSLNEQANEMLKLLKISSFEQFNSVYANLKVNFMEDGGRIEPIATWLNLAEEEVIIQNVDLSQKKYDKKDLLASLDKLKLITLNHDYKKSIQSARKFLNQLGIYLVLQEALPNSKVRGALTTYRKNPAIFLSDRFKTHDHIWFALLHEIGHLIHHYPFKEAVVTMEADQESVDRSEEEKKANQFARDFFINQTDYENFTSLNNFNKATIEQFANSQKVLPGIVVGRLQHDGYINFSDFNYLKNKE